MEYEDQSPSPAYTPAAPSRAIAAPVMDVQRPKPAAPPAEPMPPMESAAPVSEVKAEVPIATPVEPPQAPAAPLPEQPKSSAVPKRRSPIFAIAMACIVATALAGLAVYGYLQTNGTKQASSTTNTASTQPKQPVDNADTAAADMDASLGGFNESEDFTDADLNDQALGL